MPSSYEYALTNPTPLIGVILYTPSNSLHPSLPYLLYSMEEEVKRKVPSPVTGDCNPILNIG